MRVLCLNVGSSSFKWSLLELPGEVLLAAGEAALDSERGAAFDLSPLQRAVDAVGTLDAVAHRLVHGADRFAGATRIDEDSLAEMLTLESLDPTHAPKALAGIATARKAFPTVSQVACFDTAFHRTLAPAAYLYAIPSRWTNELRLRRYGFHGLSVAYAVRRAAEVLGQAPEQLLVCHLGSGSSITAVRGGRSVDTTMGFTPLEGVPMSTRSGSVDPGLLLYIMREHGLSNGAVEHALEHDSGLRGLVGEGDLREVLRQADAGTERAKLGYAVWSTGVRRGMGAMLASLDRLDGVVFTGGIGEHQARVRADLLTPFSWCGVVLDATRNAEAAGDCVVSAPGSKTSVLRIQAREDLTMARETLELLGTKKAGQP